MLTSEWISESLLRVGRVLPFLASIATRSASADSQPTTPTTSSKKVAPIEVNLDDPKLLEKLKSAIPAHCFEKDLTWSLFYLARDFAFIAALYYTRSWFASNWLTYFIWINLVGFFGTTPHFSALLPSNFWGLTVTSKPGLLRVGWALFVVGHDCGHGTFSTSPLLNQFFGHLAHAPLLVPFNGWQISHYKHHRYHNDINRDESWKPLRKHHWDAMQKYGQFVRTTPVSLFMYPWYLLSIPDHPLLSGNHFNPYSRLFAPNQRLKAAISTAAVVAFLGSLFLLFPAAAVFWYYIVPYFIFTAWLSTVTLLQHTDPKGTYYSDDSWNFTKGAFTSFDRSFGGVINHLHHNIETHLVHHLFFTAIPHYHLVEATAAVAPLLGNKYPYDGTNIFLALWRTLRNCNYIVETEVAGKHVYAKGKKSGWQAHF